LTRFWKWPILAPSSMRNRPPSRRRRPGKKETLSIHVDGSARGRSRWSVSAGHEAHYRRHGCNGGTLRLQCRCRQPEEYSRPKHDRPCGDQSLPETCGVLCPPGTRPFRGPFFARTRMRSMKEEERSTKEDVIRTPLRPSNFVLLTSHAVANSVRRSWSCDWSRSTRLLCIWLTRLSLKSSVAPTSFIVSSS